MPQLGQKELLLLAGHNEPAAGVQGGSTAVKGAAGRGTGPGRAFWGKTLLRCLCRGRDVFYHTYRKEAS